MEPFEVLPKGRINPSLVMALRTLYASPDNFSTWTNLAGDIAASASSSCWCFLSLMCFLPLPLLAAGASLPPLLLCVGFLPSVLSADKVSFALDCKMAKFFSTSLGIYTPACPCLYWLMTLLLLLLLLLLSHVDWNCALEMLSCHVQAALIQSSPRVHNAAAAAAAAE